MPRWLFWPVLLLLLGSTAVICLCGIGLLIQLGH